LAEPIQRVSRVKFGASGKVFEMRNWNDFPLRHAVEINIGTDAIFNTTCNELFLDGREFVRCGTWDEVLRDGGVRSEIHKQSHKRGDHALK
jgi:hypothetical protein